MRAGLGFLSLLITVAIIAVLMLHFLSKEPTVQAPIALADETAVLNSLRTISTAQVQFKSAALKDQDDDYEGEYGTLYELAGITTPAGATAAAFVPFIDQQLGMGSKLGYQFTVYVGESACVNGTGTDASESGFFAVAWPDSYGKTGNRSFCVDQSGTIRGMDIEGDIPDCGAVAGTAPWPPL